MSNKTKNANKWFKLNNQNKSKYKVENDVTKIMNLNKENNNINISNIISISPITNLYLFIKTKKIFILNN